MKTRFCNVRRSISLIMIAFMLSSPAFAGLAKGIYLSQPTLENTEYLNYLIKRAKKVGINTFIIDYERPSTRYQRNIQLVKNNNITYVARVVIFPGGGTPELVSSEPYREKKLKLIKQALAYGAQEIQLDYIRYNTKRKSPEHAKNIHNVIRWFKSRTAPTPLQIDVFGVSAFGESQWIGQNIKMFSQSVDAICPMVYPSHYEPFRHHAVTPYETVYTSLMAIREQFNDGKVPAKLYPYIELSNYRYPLSHEKKLAYIKAQIKAVENAGADGWYAWSANNLYDNLFYILENNSVK